MTKKLFMCVWGEGYISDTEEMAMMDEHTVDFFTEDKGYSKDDIRIINNLRLGESRNCPDVTAVHSVTRIR